MSTSATTPSTDPRTSTLEILGATGYGIFVPRYHDVTMLLAPTPFYAWPFYPEVAGAVCMQRLICGYLVRTHVAFFQTTLVDPLLQVIARKKLITFTLGIINIQKVYRGYLVRTHLAYFPNFAKNK